MPDTVLRPSVAWEERGLRLTFLARDEQSHVRVTFDGVDAHRVSRGEYDPYPTDDDDLADVYALEDSPWLAERYQYESGHYADAYEFGRDVRTMLRDTFHYVFRFHDEFVEVLARGLWFEMSSGPWPQAAPLTAGHPAHHLPPEAVVQRGTHDGIDYVVRAPASPTSELLMRARLMRQHLFELCIHGDDRPSQVVVVRAAPDGSDVRAEILGPLGIETGAFAGIPQLDEVVEPFERWMSVVARRRAALQRL